MRRQVDGPYGRIVDQRQLPGRLLRCAEDVLSGGQAQLTGPHSRLVRSRFDLRGGCSLYGPSPAQSSEVELLGAKVGKNRGGAHVRFDRLSIG